jgi:23S rRNA pseudouridine2605 synthase
VTSRIRLHKYLAEAGIASRRRSEKLIAEGQVSVNGIRMTSMGCVIDPVRDEVCVGRKVVRPQKKGVMLLNKPVGTISTMNDPEGRPCLASYITKKYSSYAPVGRLDGESSGLVIFTNDGELAEWLLHPRYQIPRVYEVVVRGLLPRELPDRFLQGILLDDGEAFGKLEMLGSRAGTSRSRIVVYEGRNRLVRRMFAAVSHPVLELHRVQHGPFHLGRLRTGEQFHLPLKRYRELRRATESLVEVKMAEKEGMKR